jgi:hypothetical protein
MPQDDDRSAIVTSSSFSPEIPETDSAATLDEEGQLNPSVQGEPIPSPSGKRSRSLSGSDRANGRGSGWVFDVFAEDDGGTEDDGSLPSKRARASPCRLEAAENRSSSVAAVVVKGVQMPGNAYDDRPPRSDKEYEIQQIVGESELEYEVTAVTKIWLPKASMGIKLMRKYRAEQRAATRVRTR